MNDATNDNPFAPPESPPVDNVLRKGQPYRVVGRQLFCSPPMNLDFSDVCWLTGQDDDLVDTIKVKVRVYPNWVKYLNSVWVIVFSCADAIGDHTGLPWEQTLMLGIGIFLATHLILRFTTPLSSITVGQSTEAQQATLNSARHRLSQTILLLLVPVLIAALVESLDDNLEPLAMFILGGAAMLALTSLGLYLWFRPKKLQITVARHSRHEYVVSGLPMPFRIAIASRHLENDHGTRS